MSLICTERNMGYHSITNFYKMMQKYLASCHKTSDLLKLSLENDKYIEKYILILAFTLAY